MMNRNNDAENLRAHHGHSRHSAKNSSNIHQGSTIITDDNRLNNVNDIEMPAANNSDINISVRLQTSICSTHSNDSDLSLALDRDVDCRMDWDELPVFEIRALSPLGRTPSPINNDSEMETPRRDPAYYVEGSCVDSSNFIALHDIDAQISPPVNGNGSILEQDDAAPSRNSSLETIFEGVFLNTPPRIQRITPNCNLLRSRANLLEKVALNRLQADKENQTPTAGNATTTSDRRSGSPRCSTPLAKTLNEQHKT